MHLLLVLLIFVGIVLEKTDSVCNDRHFARPTGTISSPKYPNVYDNNLHCNSYIYVPSERTIIITFLAFNTQPQHDWLKIDCVSERNFSAQVFSGPEIPKVLTISFCNIVNVSFHTDGSVTNTGFNLMYNITSACDTGYFSGPYGIISSPNFPKLYPSNMDCYSYIAVSPGHKVIITFLTYHIEWFFDWLSITCESGNTTFQLPPYSILHTGFVVSTYSCNLLKVYFHTDDINENIGFSLAYNITPVCYNRYFSGPSGTISSPNYPHEYVNDLDCHSHISVSAGQKVVLKFFAFDIEDDEDWVTITCESGNAFASPSYSGSKLPPIITLFSCNLVNVYLHTDYAITKSGFNLTYEFASVLKEETHQNSNPEAIILGSLFGIAILTMIIVSVILLGRRYHRQKRNAAATAGHVIHYRPNEPELRQTDCPRNRYEAGSGSYLEPFYQELAVEK